tara:strand:- start:1466 stop:2440 length:975 start_codon:yes stop_codon:yes gene_type:complete
MLKSKKQDQLKSSSTSSKGAIFLAYNNEEINYVKLACLSASSVKKHLNLPCSLITDTGSLRHFEKLDRIQIDNIFDKIIIDEKTDEDYKKDHFYSKYKINNTDNIRKYYDTPYSTFNSQFKNLTKHNVYNLSPYDQTILFDVDYLVNNDILNLAFNIDAPVQLYKNAQTLKNTEPDHATDRRLNNVGIPLYWSTVIYFDKSPMSKMFFDMWAHVKENYDYYQSVYKFPGGLYRTDFAVSISMHLLKGFNDCVDDVFAELPASPMKYMAYKDDIASVDKNGIVFFANDYKEEWNNILTYSEGENLHLMNKRAIDRHYDKLMELYV